MERFNSFNLIHKGLRASLYQTALLLQQTDFSYEEACEDALDRVREVVLLFEGHAHKEDSFILPAIAAYEPSVKAAFEEEHAEDERLGHALKAAVAKVEAASDCELRSKAGNELTVAFTAFVAFNLQHMAKEETVINEILWRYYSDDEIRMLSGRIVASIEPWLQDFYSTWMLRGINDNEASEWIRAVERGMPEIAFQTLLQKAGIEWSKERFRKVTQSLTEGVMVA